MCPTRLLWTHGRTHRDASHSLGQGQPVLAQLDVQIREENPTFHRHLLLLLVHL